MALSELLPLVSPGDRIRDRAGVGLLLVAAAVSSITFECVTPFAAFALLTAVTLAPREALGVTVAVWLVNQAVGFSALGYPFDGSSLAWGGVIGVAALAATLASIAVVARFRGPLARIALGFVAAFAVYEAVLFIAAQFLGGAENFSLSIVSTLALSDGGWLIGLVILGHLVPGIVSHRLGWRRTVTT